MKMITAKGLKIGWLKREEHARILKATKDQRTLEEMSKEFGRLKAELSDEITRVSREMESRTLPAIEADDEVDFARVLKRAKRTVSAPVKANGSVVKVVVERVEVAGVEFEMDEMDLSGQRKRGN